MARVRFTEDYRYTPSRMRRICIKYRAGSERTVKRECADAAIQAGAAVELQAPPRPANTGVQSMGEVDV